MLRDTVIELREHEDSAGLGEELRALMPAAAEINDASLTALYAEYVNVGEFYLGLEVLVALGRLHPQIAEAIAARLPQANDVVDPDVVAGYLDQARPAT